uniref:Uncharacterized protein n=1 Tax=Astyanax mexicanus TaxID=7994 RepID=A0A3B1ICZ4_ASTMX
MERLNNPHLSILGQINWRTELNKISKDLNQLIPPKQDLIDIYRTLHPKSTEYTFFSAPHHTYSKIDHIRMSQ